MSIYIVCRKKRNNPRMDVRICQKKCDLKDDCEEFISFHRVADLNKDIPLSLDPQPLQLKVA